MTADSGVGAVKEKIRALKAEKAGEKEAGKRKVLRRRINRLKKKTRKLSREAKVQAPSAAAAEATPAPAEAAEPAREAAPADEAPVEAAEPEGNDDAKDDEESSGTA